MTINCGSCLINPTSKNKIGTLGFLVHENLKPTTRYFITCAHVFSSENIKEGDKVYIETGETIGHLLKTIDIGSNLGVDVAIGLVENNNVVPDIKELGLPSGFSFYPLEKQVIFTYGASSRKVNTSFINNISANLKLSNGINIPSLLSCSPSLSKPGDSGAPVLSKNGRLLGMVIGGRDEECSYILPIKPILIALNNALNLDLSPIVSNNNNITLGSPLPNTQLTWPESAPPNPGHVNIQNDKYTDDLRTEYLTIFNACQPTTENILDIKNILKKIKTGENSYKQIQSFLKIPWFFVGFLHYRECNCSFDKHLHNGDDIAQRTIRVPTGHPVNWNPPTDWPSSAIDALKLKKLNLENDWSLPHMLFKAEEYNGFGYRHKSDKIGSPGNIASPYLWGFSDRYQKGGFPKDHVWKDEYISKQIGLGTMLKHLLNSGQILIDKNFNIDFRI